MADIDLTGRESQDEQFKKAQKSMGGHVDPEPDVEDETKDQPAKDDDPTPPAKKAPVDEPKDEEKPDPKPSEPEKDKKEDPTINRPEYHIPVKKYTDEKKEWAAKLEEKDEKIKELELLAKKPDAETPTDEIKAFADTYGIDQEGVEKLTSIIESKILPADKREFIDNLIVESAERQENEFFHKEFEITYALPDVKTLLGEVPAEKLPDLEKYIDEVAHTKEFHDKKLSYVIFEKREEIKKLLGDTPKDDDKQAEKKPQRGIESGRIGQGKASSMKASDFKDATDFSALEEMDSEERRQIVKEMDTKTYQKLVAYASGRDKGTEVMRNGRKIILK